MCSLFNRNIIGQISVLTSECVDITGEEAFQGAFLARSFSGFVRLKVPLNHGPQTSVFIIVGNV